MSPDPVTLSQNRSLIAKHPCFSQLSSSELEELSALLVEKIVESGQIIVKEDDLVDSVYFIQHGLAEVRHVRTDDEHEEVVPIAILHSGEAIGLSETGFYSMTGKRTATVVALEKCELWRLDLMAFYQFTQGHPSVSALMRENAELLLRMKLIKQAAPFAILTMENLRWLAEQVKHVSFAAGDMVFEKGDMGDQCYLIQTGKIEIFVTNEDATQTRLALLKAPMIFGEASLLMDFPRHASAKALKDSTLLMLNRDALKSVLNTGQKPPFHLDAAAANGQYPQRCAQIETFADQTADQEPTVTLRDQQNANYCRLSEQGFFIWKLLDGKHSLQAIASAFDQAYGVHDADMVSAFIHDLEATGFVEKLQS